MEQNQTRARALLEQLGDTEIQRRLAADRIFRQLRPNSREEGPASVLTPPSRAAASPAG